MSKRSRLLAVTVERSEACAALADATSFAFTQDEIGLERLREVVRILLLELGRTSENATDVIRLRHENACLLAEAKSYSKELQRLRAELGDLREECNPSPWDEGAT